MGLENRICNSLVKKEMAREARRVIKIEKEYKDYKQTMSDEEFAAAWEAACKKVKEGLKC